MAESIIQKGGGGIGSDDVTVTKADMRADRTGVTADSNDEVVAGTMPELGGWIGSVGMNGAVVIPEGHHNGQGKVNGPAVTQRGPWSSRIGINGRVAVPEGYHNGQGYVDQVIATMGGQVISPGNAQKVVECAGMYMTGNVIVQAVANLVAGNIRAGVTVGNVTGTMPDYSYLQDARVAF